MSKPIDQRNRGTTPGAARRPATATRPAPPSGNRQPATGTARATTGKAGSARPTPRNAISTTSRKPQARKGAGGWKPLDLALIFGFMVVVGVIIWFGLGGAGTGTPTNNAAGAANDAQSAASNSGPPPLAVNIGQAAPDFTLPATDGQTYSLSQFKGKVVLLEFMAPWCPHCQEDAPIFNQVHEAYKDKNVQLLAVNATGFGHNYENGDESPITMDDQTWFRDNFQVSYPRLFDKDVVVGRQYAISHFPTVFILDTNGVVVALPDNPVTFESLSAALDKALQGTASTGATGR
jgi:thiol-disulfide isomerase/thioredoxin